MQHIPSDKLAELKEKLVAEKTRLTDELASITRQNPADSADWSVKNDEARGDVPDKNDQGDAIEDLEENLAIAVPLEERLSEVEAALARIETGTYGNDEKTGEPIPLERLEANPAARTNI
jgi:DnaK suppressor protein